MDYEKLNKRLNHMFSFETDDFFVNINLKEEIAKLLYDYQFFHVFNLMTAFRSNNIILDGSDMGTGKTYTAIALCKQLNLKPFIVCPKMIMPNWKNVCELFGVNPLGIVNYESIKNGKYYNANGDRINCKFLDVTEIDKKKIEFKWKLPKYSIIIFDEVHRCRNMKSQNAQLLLSTKDQWKVLMLSGTLSDKPESFHIFGYMLNCYKNIKQSHNWINGMLLEDKTYIGSTPELSAINKYIYPNKGSRMRVKELGDKFPANQISANAYYIDEDKRELVNKAFVKINEYMLNKREIDDYANSIAEENILKSALCDNSNAQILGEIIKARQILEEVKIPIMVELANDYIENGYNVVLFVNFRNTIKQLCDSLKTKCIICGSQSDYERMNNVNSFQNNESKIIICNIAIAEGISLHDLHGVPRVSIISPSFSVTQLVQALGRISRAGAKTPALQRLVYCANTCEEIICNKLKDKLDFLAKLNDNDLVNIQ